MSELTPTETVEKQEWYDYDKETYVVTASLAKHIATELERVNVDSKQWREAALQADELSNHLSDAITERDQLRAQNAELLKDKERLELQIKSLLSPYDTFGNCDHTLDMKAVVLKIRQAIDEARHE